MRLTNFTVQHNDCDLLHTGYRVKRLQVLVCERKFKARFRISLSNELQARDVMGEGTSQHTYMEGI